MNNYEEKLAAAKEYLGEKYVLHPNYKGKPLKKLVHAESTEK